MEGVPSENQKVLAHMNWDERLRDARARRAEIMESKNRSKAGKKKAEPASESAMTTAPIESEKPAAPIKSEKIAPPIITEKTAPSIISEKTATPVDKPRITLFEPDDTVETLKPVEDNKTLPIIVEVPAEKTYVRKSVVGLAFGVGITIGVGAMLLQNLFLNRDPLPLDQSTTVALAPQPAATASPAADTTAAQITEPVVVPKATPEIAPVVNTAVAPVVAPAVAPTEEPAVAQAAEPAVAPAMPAPVAPPAEPEVAALSPLTKSQFAAIQETMAALPSDQTHLLKEIAQDLASVNAAIPVAKPAGAWTSANAQPKLGSLDPVDTLPGVGTQPEQVIAAFAAPDRAEATALLETIASPKPIRASLSRNGFDLRQIATNSSSEIAKEIREETQAKADTKPEPIEPAPTQIVDQAAEEQQPRPLFPNATDARIRIYASGSVGDDAVETAQTTIESFDLTVRAVTRVNYKISRSQIRYYDAESTEAAETLAAEIGAIARDFTSSGTNPPKGTLEVYLAGDAIVARSETSVSSPVVRAPKQRTAEQESLRESLRESLLGKIRAGLSN